MLFASPGLSAWLMCILAFICGLVFMFLFSCVSHMYSCPSKPHPRIESKRDNCNSLITDVAAGKRQDYIFRKCLETRFNENSLSTEATVHHTDTIVSVCIKEAVSCQWLTHPLRNELQWAAVLNGVSAELLPSKTGKLLCALDLHGR